eukprot:1156909-Rhodomonas_salina.4
MALQDIAIARIQSQHQPLLLTFAVFTLSKVHRLCSHSQMFTGCVWDATSALRRPLSLITSYAISVPGTA